MFRHTALFLLGKFVCSSAHVSSVSRCICFRSKVPAFDLLTRLWHLSSSLLHFTLDTFNMSYCSTWNSFFYCFGSQNDWFSLLMLLICFQVLLCLDLFWCFNKWTCFWKKNNTGMNWMLFRFNFKILWGWWKQLFFNLNFVPWWVQMVFKKVLRRISRRPENKKHECQKCKICIPEKFII